MIKKIAGIVFVVGSCLFLAFSAGPDLLRDSVHRGYWRPTREWVAEKAKCTRYSFIISNCSVMAVHRASPAREMRDLSYFTFANWGGKRVEFVHSTKDPSVISLRAATEGLTGRWAFFLAMIGVAVAAGAGSAVSLRSRLGSKAPFTV